MTPEEEEFVLSFGKANLTPSQYAELQELVAGEYSEDYDACMGWIYEQGEDE